MFPPQWVRVVGRRDGDWLDRWFLGLVIGGSALALMAVLIVGLVASW